MNEKVLKYLYDIKLALDEIDSFFAGRKKYFADYASDMLLKRAIERNLEIIGEAMSRILKEDPLFRLENSRRIIGLRNQIIHGYDSISDENIWGIIINHLPKLRQEVEKLIEMEE
jgi:uncharacterized protein with HEPN domain